MVTIEKRFKEIAYKKPHPMDRYNGIVNKPKSKNVIFLICDKLEREDFKEPFFNNAGVMSLGDGFKFLTYCGKNQRKNISKNALVIQKKLSKHNKVIYRVYLMDEDSFNIRDLFNSSEFSNNKRPCEENGYNLSPSFYIEGGLKEEYKKEELIYIINKIVGKLVNWSLEQKD